MTSLQELQLLFEDKDCRDLGSRQLEHLREMLINVSSSEINSSSDGEAFINLLRKFREAVAENDKLHGKNYPQLLNSLLSVGEDGLYSNNLRFIFELIQNVDDCEYERADDCRLDMRFDFNKDEIILKYNEKGFTPFNVFAITGIAEAAKNITASANEIGEKGIGFKSVFGVADKVRIRSGWFSFELFKDNFTIPVAAYDSSDYCPGTEMTLFVPGKARTIYYQITGQYCRKDALFSRNPLLFLNKLTYLKMYFDQWRSMEFQVARSSLDYNSGITVERNVEISINLHDYSSSTAEVNEKASIICTRYIYPVTYSKAACQSRYGAETLVGSVNGKKMLLQLVIPHVEYIDEVGNGSLYSFLPTQLRWSVPIVCHVPFKLDASREFVDPQGENAWFKESNRALATLLDYAYSDYCRESEESIVYYLPGKNESIFAKNNGKEACLSRNESFSGKHLLQLPLFKCVNGEYLAANDIVCYDQAETLPDPERVHKILAIDKALFIPPEGVNIHKFGIQTEQGIKARLLKCAMAKESVTADALSYLDSVKYDYPEEQITNLGSISVSVYQCKIIMKHAALLKKMVRIACDQIRRKQRPRFSISGAKTKHLTEVMPSGFDFGELPDSVERYLNYCGGSCFCIETDNNAYIPCHNALVLSAENPQGALGEFCANIDPKDTYSVRMKLREASIRLNKYVEDQTVSAADYLRELQNIRLSVKESLGQDGYKSYIDLILRSGTERSRFFNELIQNADDCVYREGAIPRFTAKQQGNKLITEYNEVGFSRANIRSLTAIGESTKKRLINRDLGTIGEKGVGFKSIFSVASEVKIYSGEYSFRLTDREPTIPRSEIKPLFSPEGTRMELTMKGAHRIPAFTERNLLELCLCLRKLRKIEIGSNSVTIADTEDQRVISVNKRQYVFKKYVHAFEIKNEKAIAERENETRQISAHQEITIYVPEKNALSEYSLYVGLPTKHKMRVALAIDAPFELTTSREEIETDYNTWNSIIRSEMYAAIFEVIESLKREKRFEILRYIKATPKMQGNDRYVYSNIISDSAYINDYPYLEEARRKALLPTFDPNSFAIAQERTAFRYPEALNIVFRQLPPGQFGRIEPSSIIDVPTMEFDTVFKALDCRDASSADVMYYIGRYSEAMIEQKDFREALYEYLATASFAPEYKQQLRKYKLIPVLGKNSQKSSYIAFEENKIFKKDSAIASTDDYYILNEDLLQKSKCETIFGVTINEMDMEWECARYRDKMRRVLTNESIGKRYDYLLQEQENHNIEKYSAQETIVFLKENVPLKNQLGVITTNELFICDQPEGYFPVDMIRCLIVSDECRKLARMLKCRDLSDAHFSDFTISEQLTDDDVEMLMDDYFTNSEEIIRGFYRSGLISDELMNSNGLDYLAWNIIDPEEKFEFPDAPVINRGQLSKHIEKLWASPISVVTVKKEMQVQKAKGANGELFDLSSNDLRDGALLTYAPVGKQRLCFCQMCGRVRPNRFIEVNNIETKPKYFFPQLRIALCLECSKKFESMRGDKSTRLDFIESIKKAAISSEGKIAVPIGKKERITFTATHLAEIQEILNRMPDET
ncbi:MAG: hypothetical protein II897_01585 [Clostridia bacterium]|nr:hypothetical protein [Clostridia bacterium]